MNKTIIQSLVYYLTSRGDLELERKRVSPEEFLKYFEIAVPKMLLECMVLLSILVFACESSS